MKEVNFLHLTSIISVSLVISGVCLLFHNGNIADVSSEICQSMRIDYFNASLS